jgi:hypothetical protein
MSNIISNFKNFFSKKKEEVPDKINFEEVRLTLKDSLSGVKDLGFDIKMINYSFEPITLKSLSLDIIIRPGSGNYDFNEFMSELQNAISHIEYSDMDVKMEFNLTDNLTRTDMYEIMIARDNEDNNIDYWIKDINNFNTIINNQNMDIYVKDKLKRIIIVKLDITGEHESNNI